MSLITRSIVESRTEANPPPLDPGRAARVGGRFLGMTKGPSISFLGLANTVGGQDSGVTVRCRYRKLDNVRRLYNALSRLVSMSGR
jgi:hypothetical protein